MVCRCNRWGHTLTSSPASGPSHVFTFSSTAPRGRQSRVLSRRIPFGASWGKRCRPTVAPTSGQAPPSPLPPDWGSRSTCAMDHGSMPTWPLPERLMPRKRPGALRASQWRATESVSWRIRHMSPRTSALIHHLEYQYPELDLATESALRLYRWFLAQPGRYLYMEPTGCPCHGGHFDDTALARDAIERMLRLLPPRPRRELERIVGPLDEELWRRTLPDPHAHRIPGRGGEWWHQRLYHDYTPLARSRPGPRSGPLSKAWRRSRKAQADTQPRSS